MPYKNKADQRDYQRKWIAARRAEWFADKQCAQCGSTEDMELDHIDPKQKVAHTIWSWAKHRRDEEVAKCQVLCGVHHLEKTKSDLRSMDVNAHLRRIDPPGMAWCYGHQDWLPVGEFTKNKAKRRGLETDCRECRWKRRNKNIAGVVDTA